MDDELKYMVCTRCYTYNHAPYIEDTLRGFCMQETTFPVVYCIVDDASTDGEREVLKKWAQNHLDSSESNEISRRTDYGELIIAKQKEKPNQLFVILLLNDNHKQVGRSKLQYLSEWMDNSKYIALCEGDDYWILPNKLQMQIDYMELHPDYSLIYTDANVVDERGQKILSNKPHRYSGDCLKAMILHENFLVTATVCYRMIFFKEWVEFKKQIPFKLMMGDKPLWLFLASKGLFQYIEIETTSYRLTSNSASHTKDIDKLMAFHDNSEQITLFYNDYFKIGADEKELKKRFSKIKVRKALPYSMKEAMRVCKKEIKKYPTLVFDYKLLAIFLLRIIGIKR